MPEQNLIMDPNKLKELQAQLMKLKQELGTAGQNIGNAIKCANQTWKDSKYEDFVNVYKKYQSGITTFQENLGKASTETLPPIINAAEDYWNTRNAE